MTTMIDVDAQIESEQTQREPRVDLRDRDRMVRLYVDQRVSLDALARMSGRSSPTVVKALEAHGIEIRKRGRPERAITDVCRRRRFDDRRRVTPANVFEQRLAALRDAHADGNSYATRDALIDLAATCLDWADGLPAPTLATR